MKTQPLQKVKGNILTFPSPEATKLPSLTQPEQVTSLAKLLAHRMQGIPVPTFHGHFSEEDTPDIAKMDFVERAELKDHYQSVIEAAQADLHAFNQQAQKLHDQMIVDAQKKKEPEKTEVVSDTA